MQGFALYEILPRSTISGLIVGEVESLHVELFDSARDDSNIAALSLAHQRPCVVQNGQVSVFIPAFKILNCAIKIIGERPQAFEDFLG